MTRRTLVIGDLHADRNYEDSTRLEWAAKVALEWDVDNVVAIGDWISFDSITRWNRGKPLLAEGLRLRDDFESGRDAMATFEGVIENYNAHQRRQKHAQYNPTRMFCLGNHDDRWHQYELEHPEQVGMSDQYGESLCCAEDYGWEVVKYGDYGRYCGVSFTHIPFSRVGKPIGAEHIAYQAALGEGSTVVFGHTHRRQIHSVPINGGNQTKEGISVGCYFEHIPGYISQPSKCDWWRGLVILHHVDEEKGHVDTEWLDMRRIKEMFA